MVAMIPLYISTLHQKLKRLNAENINLLDGMHEGLLILTKTNTSVQEAIKDKILFCNRSAEKLLSRAVSLESSKGTDQGAMGKIENYYMGYKASFESRIVKPRIFHPVKIIEKDHQVKKFTEMFENCEDSASLEDIMTAQVDEPH